MKTLKNENIEISKIQYKRCLERIQLFFYDYPEYDGEQSPNEYVLDFQTALTETIEDICFEFLGIRNRDILFRIADSVSSAFMESFEFVDKEEEKDASSLGFDLTFLLHTYESELKEKGIDPKYVLEYPRIYKMALKKDKKAMELIDKLMEKMD